MLTSIIVVAVLTSIIVVAMFIVVLILAKDMTAVGTDMAKVESRLDLKDKECLIMAEGIAKLIKESCNIDKLVGLGDALNADLQDAVKGVGFVDWNKDGENIKIKTKKGGK